MGEWNLFNFGQKYKVNNGWDETISYKRKWSDMQKLGDVNFT